MIWLLALGAAISTPTPSSQPLAEASHALDAGRPEQARLMIADALAKGGANRETDRLLARLALAEHRNDVALAGFRELLRTNPADPQALTGAAIAAARLRDDSSAQSFAEAAAKLPTADWRVFDLLGVLADRRGDWAASDRAYEEALKRAPKEPAVLNNAGWSQLARGRWAKAEALFEQAVAAQPANRLFANNLELAQTTLAAELPARRTGENDSDYAARLNDAGVAARLRGDRQRAVAAFARAVEVNRRWDERAYNNLIATQAAR